MEFNYLQCDKDCGEGRMAVQFLYHQFFMGLTSSAMPVCSWMSVWYTIFNFLFDAMYF